jgi:multicomponent Na+:H+ antiporter subunit C
LVSKSSIVWFLFIGIVCGSMAILDAIDGFRVMEALLLLTVFTGLVGLLLRRNLFLKVMGMDVMGTGVIAFFVLVAARSGFRTPILDGSAVAVGGKDWADPIPQAVILTAVVIGLSIQALLLVAITRLASVDPSLDGSQLDQLGRD